MAAIIIMMALCFSSTISANNEIVSKDEADLVHSLSPVAACNMNLPINVYEKLDDCHKKCSLAPRSKDKLQITLLKDTAELKGPAVVRCTKVKIEQIFTETWTFSQIMSEPIFTPLSISDEECQKQITEKCPKMNCNIKRPHKLDPEYSYASDVTKRETFVELVAHPSSLLQVDSITKVIPVGTKDEFKLEDKKFIGRDEAYYWESVDYGNACPFKEGLKMGCDKVDYEGSDFVICGSGRFAFKYTDAKPLTGVCKDKGMKITSGGILFSESSSVDNKDYKSQKLSMKSSAALTGDAETARVLSNNAILHLDADVCALQCDLASVEVKLGRSSVGLVQIGSEYILLSPKGYGYQCNALTYCTLVKPYTFCGSPASLLIRCNGKNYYWDPRQNYVLSASSCASIQHNDTLNVHIGNAMYRVDDDMQIKLNKEDVFSYKMRSYLLYHGSMFSQEDLSQIGTSWKNKKAQPTEVLSINEERIVDQKSLGITNFIGAALSPLTMLWKMLSNAEIITVLLLCGLMTYLALKYVIAPYIVSRGRNRNPYTETVSSGRRRSSQLETVWL
ncbi:TPA_asm: G [Triticum alphacytorhabdovirus 1]|nr:TPA_asm: G [Triticum alphacytorhabdovirus 1]